MQPLSEINTPVSGKEAGKGEGEKQQLSLLTLKVKIYERTVINFEDEPQSKSFLFISAWFSPCVQSRWGENQLMNVLVTATVTHPRTKDLLTNVREVFGITQSMKGEWRELSVPVSSLACRTVTVFCCSACLLCMCVHLHTCAQFCVDFNPVLKWALVPCCDVRSLLGFPGVPVPGFVEGGW